MTEQTSIISNNRQKLLDKSLPFIELYGFNDKMLEAASIAINKPHNYHKVIFESGISDFIKYFLEKIDIKMLENINKIPNFNSLKIREKITLSLQARIDIFAADKEIYHKLTAALSKPPYLGVLASNIWQSADKIWHNLQDNSTDFNYYSKRALLSTVIFNLYLYILTDNSPNYTDSRAFTARNIDNLIKIITKCKKVINL